MKFAAVVLLACVAVSSAAFTANLVQHTQPAVAKAMFSVKLAAGSNKVALPGVQEAFAAIVAGMENAITAIVSQAQELMQAGQAVSGQLITHLQTMIQNLQAFAGPAVSGFVQSIQQFIDSVVGTIGGNKKISFSQAVAIIQEKIRQAIALAQQLISQIDLPTLLHDAIVQVLPPNVAQMVIAQMNMMMNNKGFWDSIGNFFGGIFGNVWDQLTTVAGDFAAQVAAIGNAVLDAGASAFGSLQSQGELFLNDFHNGIMDVSADAAEIILQNIGSFAGALGDTFEDVVAALNSIVASGKSRKL